MQTSSQEVPSQQCRRLQKIFSVTTEQRKSMTDLLYCRAVYGHVFYSMAIREYGHETKYEMYEKIHDVYKGDTFLLS